MCEHRPFSRDLCKPYKAIRNTAKAFLKTHEKKLADERVKAAATSDAAQITNPAETGGTNAVSNDQVGDTNGDARINEPPEEDALESTHDLPLEDQPRPSIEVSTSMDSRQH
jgi:hypothetical protein